MLIYTPKVEKWHAVIVAGLINPTELVIYVILFIGCRFVESGVLIRLLIITHYIWMLSNEYM